MSRDTAGSGRVWEHRSSGPRSGPRSGLRRWVRAGVQRGILGIVSLLNALGAEGPSGSLEDLGAEFTTSIQPLVKQYCLGCHSTEKQKGDLDLERFGSLKEILAQPKAWQGVVEQMALGEMPPKDKPQPSAADRERLMGWVHRALDRAARDRAGDPGPVVLRRLNNAEYTYTIRDLTGVAALDPAREFPADSAAGEGFRNTGNSLVMSPALLTKYLDAGKELASRAVLLPDGFRFSASAAPRDWTDEILAELREFYRGFTDAGGADKVNLQGIIFDTNEGGRIPLKRYFSAAFELRQGVGSAALVDQARVGAVAGAHGLSPKYLSGLVNLLAAGEPSPLLERLRTVWRTGTRDEVAGLAGEVERWQRALWKFNSVGHLGKLNGPVSWMEAVTPLQERYEVRLKLAAPTNGNDIVIRLEAGDGGDGNAQDLVVWQRPRLVVPGRPDLLIRDVREFVQELTVRRERLLASTLGCLTAAAEVAAAPSVERTDRVALARKHKVPAELLGAWLDYLGIGTSDSPRLEYFTNKLSRIAGYDFVAGWGSAETPNLSANASTQHVRIPGNLKGRGLTVHPSPKLQAAVGWQSPVAGAITVEAAITHAHPECGNGVTWTLELRRGATRQRLAAGTAQGGRPVKAGPVDGITARTGDLISLLIGPRDGNHACDLTDIELKVKQVGGGGREWVLTQDVTADVHAGNPHADGFGNPAVWHFYTEPVSGAEGGPVIPSGSLLAKWLSAADASERGQLAIAVHALLASAEVPKVAADALLRRQLTALGGPLLGGARQAQASLSGGDRNGSRGRGARRAKGLAEWGVDPGLFGRGPGRVRTDAESFCVQAPSVVEIRLPADLAAGAELVTTGLLHTNGVAQGSVQLQAATVVLGGVAASARGPAPTPVISPSVPFVAAREGSAWGRISGQFDLFRQWFPAALCYPKIVPVDEVITLTLFHREDEPLRRLMLDPAQERQLDRLWSELRFVSRDALTVPDAFAQLMEYASQDADPRVFEPLRKPIQERAEAFRKELVGAEPVQVDALVRFAARAFRRPLSDAESRELRELHGRLRGEGIPHEEAFRLTLARVFASPGFLYRLENAPPGTAPGPVSDLELASRLSYFLWSSAPDAELMAVAREGRLREPSVLMGQARRLLSDGRARRLAAEFACQWLHIYEFDTLDEKSERHFPSFNTLKGDMYEESIRFFAALFQGNGSILSLLDADHTFVNGRLAEFYGIPGVDGKDWQRVDGMRRRGRGGVLGLSAPLAKQAGASRTSPILRGNWVAEVLLGEKLPRPPKDVPRLPEEEGTEGMTVRQLVEKHSSDPKCSGCHIRIDSFGFALEAFDAIGRQREKDMGNRPIEVKARLMDGQEVDGLAGLREYLGTRRRAQFVRHFCRKLLGYALGRSVMLSDSPLLDQMTRALEKDGHRFEVAVQQIITSPQFLQIRGADAPRDE